MLFSLQLLKFVTFQQTCLHISAVGIPGGRKDLVVLLEFSCTKSAPALYFSPETENFHGRLHNSLTLQAFELVDINLLGVTFDTFCD